MNMLWETLGTLSLGALFCACYYFPTQKIESINKDDIPVEREVMTSAKVHLLDGSVILYHDGFTRGQDSLLHGFGERYDLSRNHSVALPWIVPLDSIVAVEYYDSTVSAGRALAMLTFAHAAAAQVLVTLLSKIDSPGPHRTVEVSDGNQRQFLQSKTPTVEPEMSW